MTAFAAPIAEQIWDMKYRLKTPDGAPVDETIEATWTRIADALAATELLILTGVPCAYRHFGTDRQEPIRRATPDQAEALIQEGHFAPGSMLPKIEAAVQFARTPGRTAVICDPASALEAIAGRAGTTIG